MVSIKDAIKAIEINSFEISVEIKISVDTSGNSILFRDIYSPINMPPFRQSAMDGYALNLHEELTYKVVGEVKAGEGHQGLLKKGEAVRIFTGAVVPDSANAVIMQEKVVARDNIITIEATPPIGINIRLLGEQVEKGQLALKKGTKLSPAAIGFLNSLGITEVSVYKKPAIAVISTGSELVDPGEPLTYGKIYESNSKMLQNALMDFGFDAVSVHKIEDNYDTTYSKLQEVIVKNDMVIISGGISVGEYDFVGKALKDLKVEEVFYKVNQKPGKPLFFGKYEETLLFALPGNPAAALTCFYFYVYIALQKMSGSREFGLPKVMAKSTSSFVKKAGRPQILKAVYNEGQVSILEGQSSAMLQTFAISNALVTMPQDLKQIDIHDIIEVILLPV